MLQKVKQNRHLISVVIVAVSLRVGIATIFPMGAEYDLVSYRLVGEAVLNGENVYRVLPARYPYFPGWMFIEAVAVAVSNLTGAPFWLVIRLPQIIADATLCLVIYKLLQEHIAISNISPLQGALFHALNPVAIAIIGGHGQFDSLPILALVLSIGFMKTNRVNISALVLGLGIVLKPVPLFFGLILLAHLPDKISRIKYFVISATPTALLSIPFLFADPFIYIKGTLGYSSGALMSWLTPINLVEAATAPPDPLLSIPFPPIPSEAILSITKYGFLLSIIFVSFYYLKYKDNSTVELFRVSLLIILLFYTISAALAAQYPYWAMPLLPLVNISNKYRFILMISAFSVSALWYIKSYAIPGFALEPTIVVIWILFVIAIYTFWVVSAYGSISILYDICASSSTPE